MKKLLSSILAVTLMSTLVGCSSSSNETAKTTSTPESTVTVDEEKNADVIIVGAGGGGLSAAIEAVKDGAESVIILEKTSVTGGSMNYTSGSMSGAETIIQEIDGVEDTKESYVQDILKNGAGLGNEELIREYVDEDVDAINWLWENGLSDNKFSTDKATGTMSVFAPEHALYSVKRTYKASPDDSENYKCAAHEILDAELAKLDNVTIDFQTTAESLVANSEGQVLTVLAKNGDGKTVSYTANKGIIMATGGYSGNLKMMGTFTTYGGEYLPGGASTADGYGIYMMQEVGANINEEWMSYIPTFPMGLDTGNGPGKIAPTYLWKTGGICVNKEGNRFVNETESAVEVRETALEEQTDAIQYDIFTDKIIADAEELNASVFWTYYYAPEKPYNQYVVSADSIEELAEKIGVPADSLKTTIEKYNECVETQTTDEFGREYTEDSLNTYNVAINKVEGDKYYAVALKALCVMTLGGVEINTKGQVVDTEGNAIPGLYAAGECVGGIWGKFVSGGTGIMGPIVFGRIAARNLMSEELATGYTLKTPQTVITSDMFTSDTTTTSRFDMSTPLTDGEYQATVDGQEGDLTVSVTIADGKISKVEVLEAHESSFTTEAQEKVPERIVENNSPDVDTVSGATLTSNRIMDAVAICLEEASK